MRDRYPLGRKRIDDLEKESKVISITLLSLPLIQYLIFLFLSRTTADMSSVSQ